jgi:protein-tyrosine-phosphatase
MKQKVLFVCVHNSARSQIAATLLNKRCGEFFEAESAGLEAGELNPLAVEALKEVGIDISRNKTQAALDVFKSGQLFAYVITVCDESEKDGCPIFPAWLRVCAGRFRIHRNLPERRKRNSSGRGTFETRSRVRFAGFAPNTGPNNSANGWRHSFVTAF